MLENYIAKIFNDDNPKTKESFVQHTDRVIKAVKELENRYEPILHLEKDFWFDAFVMAIFHDFGKLSDNFSNNMNIVWKGGSTNFKTHIRHEFLSGMLLAFHTQSKARIRKDLSPNHYQLFAIYTHHKSLNSNLFSEINAIKIKREAVDGFRTYLLDKFLEYFPQKTSFLEGIENSLKIILEKETEYFRTRKDMFFEDSFENFKKTSHRTNYIYFKAILVAADWTGSGRRSLENPLVYNQSLLFEKMKHKLGERFSQWSNFQNNSLVQRSNVIAIAPTGSGKTEASMLWASNRSESGAEKIVYLLPTKVTANAIFERLANFFGRGEEDSHVAVVHSSAKSFRAEKDDEKENPYPDLVYLRDSAFFRSVTVATVDQMLTMGFNCGWWELKTFHLSKAKVIIDEIHAFQPYTLGLIVATIKYLREHFGTQFYIMTATLPPKLRELLIEEAFGGKGNLTEIRDEELLQKSRNYYRVEDKDFDELIPEIKKRLSEKKKVLVVVNTVNEAIRIFDHEELADRRDEDKFCYHSRFTVGDRREKEKLLLEFEKKVKFDNGFLLISTQVCEVSLDIDYDFLYTENAPVDAIIQRAGRVNRKRDDKKFTEVIIFKHLKVSELVYEEVVNNQEKTNFLVDSFEAFRQRQNEKLTEQDLLNIVEDVYGNWDITKHPSYMEAIGKYEKLWRFNLNYIQGIDKKDEDLFTREGIDNVTIIPLKFKDELEDKSAKEKSQYEVSIRRKLFNIIRSHIQKIGGERPFIDKDDFTYLAVPYNLKRGFYYSFEEAKEMFPQEPLTVFV